MSIQIEEHSGHRWENFISALPVSGRKAASSASESFGSSPSIVVHPLVFYTSTEYSPSPEIFDDCSLLASSHPPFSVFFSWLFQSAADVFII